eukprot:4466814-Heterocapsa_arctica.AAC.1
MSSSDKADKDGETTLISAQYVAIVYIALCIGPQLHAYSRHGRGHVTLAPTASCNPLAGHRKREAANFRAAG